MFFANVAELNLLGDDHPDFGCVSAKSPEGAVADIAHNFSGLGKGIAYALLVEFPGAPECIGSFVDVRQFEIDGIAPAEEFIVAGGYWLVSVDALVYLRRIGCAVDDLVIEHGIKAG